MKLAGIAEIADLLKVSRPRARQLADRDDFPAPVGRLKMGPVWREADIKKWIRKHRAGAPTVVAVALAALALGAPASARADHGEPVTDPLVVESLQIAQDFWGVDVPCAHVAWADATSVTTAAAQGSCSIWLSRTGWPALRVSASVRCQAIAHEFGHLEQPLLDHGHGGGAPPLMQDAGLPGLVPQCRRFDGTWLPFTPLQRVRRGGNLPVRLARWLARTRESRPRACVLSRSRCPKSP